MSKKQREVLCPNCGVTRLVFVDKIKRKGFTGFCSKCNGHRVMGENHPQWKGGITKRPDGYISIRLYEDSPFYSMANDTSHQALKHRVIMAQSLGRVLVRTEIVHHLNGDRADNRLKNLCIVDNHTHNRRALIESLQKRIKELEGILKNDS